MTILLRPSFAQKGVIGKTGPWPKIRDGFSSDAVAWG
jgi:hypothetical protein